MKKTFIDSCGEVDIGAKLEKQLIYILSNSKFYQKKFQKLGITANNINDFDFQKIPFTEKSEILDDQKKFPPFGSNLCVSTNKIQRIHSTSGTTNKPLIIAMTKKDVENTIKAGSKCFSTAGLNDNDIVVHCLNYCMWAGGYTDHQSLEGTGAAVIPFGVGNSHKLIETIKDLNVTAISCTPSYLAKLELLMKTEFNMDPKQLGLKLGLFGAESGLQYPNFRKKIENIWGINAMNANFGMADVLSMFGSECSQKDGLHFISEGNLMIELLDPKEMKIIDLKKGAVGEIILTNLEREAQPLIRFRTHDMIEIIDTGKCKCGLETFRFNIIGRSDDMIVVKGLNVFPHQIKTILGNHLDKTTGEFEIIVKNNAPIEDLNIMIECTLTNKSEQKELKEILFKEIRQNLLLSPNITLVSEGSLKREEGKTKHIKYID